MLPWWVRAGPGPCLVSRAGAQARCACFSWASLDMSSAGDGRGEPGPLGGCSQQSTAVFLSGFYFISRFSRHLDSPAGKE